MKILTKNQFLEEPNGTIYMTARPDTGINNGIYVKTGAYNSIYDKKLHWNGRLDLVPIVQEDQSDPTMLYTNWATWDDSDADDSDKDLFYVFSETEVLQIINCLTWALTGCKGRFEEDYWYYGNQIPIPDNEIEEYIK